MANEEVWQGRVDRTYHTSRQWLDPIPVPPPGAPNVIMIVLDDVGFAQLGCYGSAIDTPNIDRLSQSGLRYTNFHTTAMCSPTRACLLTGRNHHAVGMGLIADWCTGYPGYQGEVTRRAATLAEMLQPIGFSTFAIGKWHLTRVRDMTAAGPFGQWPLGRGFERYYGFLYSLMDHWDPELICDNHVIPTPKRDGYHLSEDLVDQTISMIRDQQIAAPGRRFFAYLAFGACHSPHHAPRPFIEKYRGRFNEGWNIVRERAFRRQLELGVIPSDTRLSAWNSEVRHWDSMTTDEKRLCARQQEVFAGFLEHTDAQIGRLLDYLESRDLRDDTMIVLLSDNGASGEGGDLGTLNLRCTGQRIEEPFARALASVDQLGTAAHWNNYASGWGHAGNAPLKWFKTHTHGGGVRDPLIISWPTRIRSAGQVRSQFCHCTDIVPTVLEAVGIEAPKVVLGREQLPIDGRSLAPSFDTSSTSASHRVQYFELLGNRGLWADGWKAVARHQKGTDFEADRWELYHVDNDFSEAEDLASRNPEKLSDLVDLWWQEAKRNSVLPLDDRDYERSRFTYWGPPRTLWRFEQGMNRATGYSAPAVADRSYRIIADVRMGQDTEGVILAVGGRAGGYVIYVQGRNLVHEYIGPHQRFVLEATMRVAPGRHRLEFRFTRTAHCTGHAALLCDGQELAQADMYDMWPLGPTAGGVFCGFDDASPVSERYALPFRFSGDIYAVTVEASDEMSENAALANLASLSED